MFVHLPGQLLPLLSALFCMFSFLPLSASELAADALEEERDAVLEAELPERAERSIKGYADFYDVFNELTRTGRITDSQLNRLFEALDATPDSPFLAATLLAGLRRSGNAELLTERFAALARKHPPQFMLSAIAADLLQIRKRRGEAISLLRHTADFLRRAENRDELIQDQFGYAEYVLLKLVILLAMERNYADSEHLIQEISGWKFFRGNPFLTQLSLINQAALRRSASDRRFLWIFPSEKERAQEKFEATAKTYLRELEAIQEKGEKIDLRRHSPALNLLAAEKCSGAESAILGNLLNSPGDIPSLLVLAEYYAKSGMPVSAARVWRHIFRIGTNPPLRFYLAYADALSAASMTSEAAGIYELALLMAPRDANVKFRLGRLLYSEGKYREALELLGDLSLPAARYLAALCCSFLGKHAEALRYFKALHADRSSARAPAADSILFLYAESAEKAGEHQLAERLLRSFLERNRDSADALNFLGYTFAERGENLDEAEKLIRRALELQPENRDYLDSMAWVFYRRKQYREALKWILRAVESEPEKPFSATILDHAGDILDALGDRENAVRRWKEAVSNYSPEEIDVRKILNKIRNAGGAL